MDIWELISIASVAAVVILFSGPRAALTKPIQNCAFEVFVEMVDRMNWSLAPALTALLPAAFLSLILNVLTSYREFPNLFLLEAIALLLFSAAFLVAIVFELPIIEKIATWPAALTVPDDWQNTRQSDEEKQAWHVQHILDKKAMLYAFIKELEVIPPVRSDSKAIDNDFARMAVEEARKSRAEDDRPHPKVGCVVVKDGKVLAKAHRGEFEANHAEFAALEQKLKDETLAGCTVYATLEPCTGRNHPKVPCADRLIARRVARVVIGILDPNPEIRGKGVIRLQEAGIAVELFPAALANELLELNRDFISSFAQPGPAVVKAKEDRKIKEKRKLYNLIRKINCIQCSFAFPPGPQDPCFNGALISQINKDIDAIRDDLVDLLDLPEAKAIVDLRIPSAPYEGASWLWLEATWREYFQPMQEIFNRVKAEVLRD